MNRAKKALIPILSGMLIDIIDLATFGPLGVYAGLVIGGAAAYVLCILQGVAPQKCLYVAIAAGLYCMTPLTEFIPIGTAVGVYIAWNASSE